MKSMRILFLLALIQISLSSCFLWKECILSFKQSTAFFIGSMVFVSGICAGVNYLYTRKQEVHSVLASKKSVKLFYSMLLLINLLGAVLVLSDNLFIKNTLQQELVDFLLPSFFFLFGLDLLIFLPLKKYVRDFLAMLDRKKTVLVTILATLLFLRNPMTIVSLLIYTGLGLFLQPILSQIRLRRKFPFMVIFSEILYWSLLRSFSFRESLFFMDVMMISLVGK
ncbi:putative membrane protein [Streptococcus pneumoniae GA16833]|nr:putative membrane protein [Streptococcus pneumoniae GA16833]